ncbi:MAG: hypothetical protein R2706_16830 [Acidimicrobiales bacterium]
MGFFANNKSRPEGNDAWLTNLLDEDAIPLAELEAATNPFVAPAAVETPDAWHFPEVDLSMVPMSATSSLPQLDNEYVPFDATPLPMTSPSISTSAILISPR